MNLATLDDEQLKQFDANGDGTLQAPQLANFFMKLFRSVGYDVVITLPMAQQAIKEIDLNNDGKVSPYELYCAFKLMNSQSQIYLQTYTPINDHIMDVQNCQQWNWNWPS